MFTMPYCIMTVLHIGSMHIHTTAHLKSNYSIRRKQVAKAIHINFAHNSIFGASYGKKDGIRVGDKLLVVRRSLGGLVVTGFGKVYEVTKDAFNADGRNWQFSSGDEAYIVSRDDSPYSLAKQPHRSIIATGSK